MSPWLLRGNTELAPFTLGFVGKPYALLLLSWPSLSGDPGLLLNMQPLTPQESSRATGTASPLRCRHGRWVAEVLQENSVTALMGLAKT